MSCQAAVLIPLTIQNMFVATQQAKAMLMWLPMLKPSAKEKALSLEAFKRYQQKQAGFIPTQTAMNAIYITT